MNESRSDSASATVVPIVAEPARSAIQQVQPVRGPYPKTARRVLEHSPHVIIGQRVRILRVVTKALHHPAVSGPGD